MGMAERIKERRQFLDMTQEELGKNLGCKNQLLLNTKMEEWRI